MKGGNLRRYGVILLCRLFPTANENNVGARDILGVKPKISLFGNAEGQQIVCDATIGDVTTFGGQTLDVNSFGCTIYFNGKPTVTSAP